MEYRPTNEDRDWLAELNIRWDFLPWTGPDGRARLPRPNFEWGDPIPLIWGGVPGVLSFEETHEVPGMPGVRFNDERGN